MSRGSAIQRYVYTESYGETYIRRNCTRYGREINPIDTNDVREEGISIQTVDVK